jgi:hypothetical protein
MNWKRIAQKRFEKIRLLQRRADRMREQAEKELEREMVTMFHAACYPLAVYEGKVKQMSQFIAERLYPRE